MPASVRSQGASFTAYLVSPRFPALAAENALVMDELNVEVRNHLDEAKKLLKAHFAARGEDRAAELIGNWIHEQSYPFDEDDDSKERERFDKAAVELSAKFDSFAALSADERGIVLKLLKNALAGSAGNTLKSVLS
jgi:hypothetical protein